MKKLYQYQKAGEGSDEEYACVLVKYGVAGGKSLEPIVREILLAKNED